MEPNYNLNQFSIVISDTTIFILKEKVPLLKKSSPADALSWILIYF